MGLTGRSSAKRAKRIAQDLKRRREYLESAGILGDTMQATGTVRTAQAAYGLPGGESSGQQAVQSSIGTQAVTNTFLDKEIGRIEDNLQHNIKRAKRKAKTLKLGIAVASVVTGGIAGAAGAAAGKAAAGTATAFGSAAAGLGLTSVTTGMTAGKLVGGLIGEAIAPEVIGADSPMARRTVSRIGGRMGGNSLGAVGLGLPNSYYSPRNAEDRPNINASPFR